MKKYKYIRIAQTPNEYFNDRALYRIYNNNTNQQIGMIFYYAPWKRYVFATVAQAFEQVNNQEMFLFDAKCMRDIIHFIENNDIYKKFVAL